MILQSSCRKWSNVNRLSVAVTQQLKLLGPSPRNNSSLKSNSTFGHPKFVTGGSNQSSSSDTQKLWNNVSRSLTRTTSSTSYPLDTDNDDNNKNNNKSNKAAESIPTNDLEQGRRLQFKKQEKLDNLLNELGFDLHQWRIRNTTYNSSRNYTQTRRRRRRKKPALSTSSFRRSNRQRPSTTTSHHDILPNNSFDHIHHHYDLKNNNNTNNDHVHSLTSTTNHPSLSEAAPSDEISARLHVKSIHAAQTIDLVSVLTKVFFVGGSAAAALSQNQQPHEQSRRAPLNHVFGRTSVIVQLPSPKINNYNHGDDDYYLNVHDPINEGNVTTRITRPSTATATTTTNTTTNNDDNPNSFSTASSKDNNYTNNNTAMKYFHPQQSPPRFIAIFRFGSIVFFNIPSKEIRTILEEIKKQSTDPISRGFERKERFEVAICPHMKETALVASGDFCTVKELDMNCVAVLSTIMAQTTALDSYNDTVDELLAKFAKINSTVKKTGNFTDMERDTLFKVVAQNNSLFIDMLAKLGIHDRSDTAWNLTQYEKVHEGMREEFEIESRFDQIEFKLNLIQQNAKFFLEILDNQKSNTLEWIIIVLISFECVLMILEMSGAGSMFFDMAPATIPIETVLSKSPPK